MKTSQEFDPIVSVAMLPVFGANAATSSGAHTASVLWPPMEARTRKQPAAGRTQGLGPVAAAYWHYELDLRHHPVVLRFSLPAREEAFAFTATVTLLWAVRNPVEVALQGVRDLKLVIWTFLDQALRSVSRHFGIEEVRAAEAEMRLILEKQSEEFGFGLRLPMVGVSLRLDEDTERYLSQRVQTGRDVNLADDRHGLARQAADWRGRIELAQAAHQRDLDEAQAMHRREPRRSASQHAPRSSG